MRRPTPTSGLRNLARPGGLVRTGGIAFFLLALSMTKEASGQEQPLVLPAVTLLDSAPPSHAGTRYVGGRADRQLGQSVTPVGDINGDGWPDLAVSSPISATEGGADSGPGRVWIAFGGRSFPTTMPLDGLNQNGLVLTSGANSADRLGSFIAGAATPGGGDIDGDDHDDLLLGIPQLGATPDGAFPNGAVALVFGRDGAGSLVLANSPGFVTLFHSSAPGDGRLGFTGASIGDVNGDGRNDFAIGSVDASIIVPNGRARVGKVWVVFGGSHLRSRDPLSIDLATLPVDQGFALEGPSADSDFGSTISALGDIDDDGIADFAIGARSEGAGNAYVVFGGAGVGSIDDWTVDLGSSHQRITGLTVGDAFASAIAGGLDVTGDGTPDLLIGAPGRAERGSAYFIPGGDGLRVSGLLEDLGSTELFGSPASETGHAVAMVPDLNRDARAELLIGAPARDFGLGAAYLAYGREAFPATIRLEALNPRAEPFGARFYQNSNAARLGQSVAGFGDRRGTGNGGFAIGAPFASALLPNAGLVYEVVARPGGDAPRSLTCRALPGPRVRLDWNNPGSYSSISIYRDGRRIAGPLPGRLTQFYDTEPTLGEHVYFVEANDSPLLRSGTCRAVVESAGVQNLICAQAPGSTRVRLRWRNSDRYDAIRVFAGDELIEELPPFVDDYSFDPGPGRVDIRVVTLPGDNVARCSIEVVDVDLPPIRELLCAVENLRDVRLSWRPDARYDIYEIRRDGVRIARTATANFIDADAPIGPRSYAVSGLLSSVHRGPASFCNVDVIDPVGLAVVAGQVAFDDIARTPLGRGLVTATNNRGQFVARGQVDGSGNFSLNVPVGAAVSLRYELTFDPLETIDTPILLTSSKISRVVAGIDAGDDDIEIIVPLPVLAVAPLRTDPEHWRDLLQFFRTRHIFFGASLPSGLGRASRVLSQLMDATSEHLRRELGRAPTQCDLVAFGATGLAARVVAHIDSGPRIRKLVLLGSPNLGTHRAEKELRRDLTTRPLLGAADSAEHAAASEQIPRFLESFNTRINNTHGADVHLVAGSGGEPELDAVLECDEHDDRVCVESALGGISGATLHIVPLGHSSLGRGERSLSLLFDEVGIGDVRAEPPQRGEDLRGGVLQGGGANDGGDEDGGGAGIDLGPGTQSGDQHDGVLLPGDDTEIPLHSDTSGSIIIILNSELPGSIVFSVRTPAGQTIDPASAAGLGIGYFTYSEGEGQVAQSYHFPNAEEGSYVAVLANESAENSIEFHLELFVESTLVFDAALEEDEIDPGAETTVTATLTDAGEPIADATVRADLWRPNGSLEILELLDDGQAPDTNADDGIYTATVPASQVAGFHVIELEASDAAQSFTRTDTVQLVVRSDAGELGADWTSGLDDLDADGVPDELWLEGDITAITPASFLVLATLETSDGTLVDEAGVFVEPRSPGTYPARIIFNGPDLFARELDGPYIVSKIQLIDVTVGFAPADLLENAHETADYSWQIFGVLPDSEAFRRGDPNADGATDITDAIFILLHLFGGGSEPPCSESGDANADDRVDLSDAIYILDFLFTGGAVIPLPFPDCANVEAADCASYPPCE